MKFIVILSLLATHVFASNIVCKTDDEKWTVVAEYDIPTMVASKLTMSYMGEKYKEFKNLEINTYSIKNPFTGVRTHYYEFQFPSAQYVDLERKSEKGVMSPIGTGVFVKNANLFTVEKAVNCQFID